LPAERSRSVIITTLTITTQILPRNILNTLIENKGERTMIPACDISKYQGAWHDYPADIILTKISGGDAGLYIDPQAATNYNGIIAAGKAFGGYHFAGGTDPIAEANYYLNAMQPWNYGEVPALDWEVSHPDPVGWCLQFTTHVHDVAGAWPLIYVNLATLRAYDWSPVLSNCGLWLADWNNDPNTPVDTGGKVYVMQQYSDGPNYDHDEWFGTIDEFKKYGWPAPVLVPAPTLEPAPAPVETPTPPAPTSEPAPLPAPQPTTPPAVEDPKPTAGVPSVPPAPTVVATPPKVNWLAALLQFLIKWFKGE
jgi:hypothetical protein